MDLVRSELRRCTANVTVILTVAPCEHPIVMPGQCHQAGTTASAQCSFSPNGLGNQQGSDQTQDHLQPTGNQAQQEQQQQHQDVGEHTLEQQQQVQSSGQLQHQQHEQEHKLSGGQRCNTQPSKESVFVELLSDNYQDVMSQTVREVDAGLKLAWQLLTQCRMSFSCLVSFYGENAQAFANDVVFWSDIITFVERFTACQKQLRKQMQVCLRCNACVCCLTSTCNIVGKRPLQFITGMPYSSSSGGRAFHPSTYYDTMYTTQCTAPYTHCSQLLF